MNEDGRLTMDRPHPAAKPDPAPQPPSVEESSTASYRGVELAPKTLESLVTWDVCGHARGERDRLDLAYRRSKDVEGGY
jgi:hypothetical protein